MSETSETLVCPLCGGQRGSHVTDTRQCADAILRFRRCFNCHSLFDTVERPDGPERRDDTPTPSPAMSDDPNDPRLVSKPATSSDDIGGSSVTDDPSTGPSISIVPKRKYTRKTPLSTE